MENGHLPRHDIDPRTNLEVIWRSGEESKHAQYSLVKVPNDIPFKIVYEKPSLNIEIDLVPESLFRWKITGKLDPDTLENLNLSISKPRSGNNPPIVTEADLEKIRQCGEIIDISGNKTLFDTKIIVPVNNMYRFLYKVWRPVANTRKFQDIVPNYSLGQSDKKFRILPQKIVNELDINRKVTLLVNKT
jgi:hypothetical protein